MSKELDALLAKTPGRHRPKRCECGAAVEVGFQVRIYTRGRPVRTLKTKARSLCAPCALRKLAEALPDA